MCVREECNIQCARSGCFVAVFSVGVSRDKGRPLRCEAHLHMLPETKEPDACRAGAWYRSCHLIGRSGRRATLVRSRHCNMSNRYLSAGTHAGSRDGVSSACLALALAANVVMVAS